MNLKKYKKLNSEVEIILKEINPRGKFIADVGCGIGNLTRWLANHKAKRVFGIDIEKIIEKATQQPNSGNEIFIAGKGQKLPLAKEVADCMIYFASFHHVPENKMSKAFAECKRVLKPDGIALIVEPVFETGCYCELSKLVRDEKQIQKTAYEIIKKAVDMGFEMLSEKFYYIPRTYDDFKNALSVYVKSVGRQKVILEKANLIIRKHEMKHKNLNRSNLFKSTVRVNVLRKK